jgi:hypothetical protein
LRQTSRVNPAGAIGFDGTAPRQSAVGNSTGNVGGNPPTAIIFSISPPATAIVYRATDGRAAAAPDRT